MRRKLLLLAWLITDLLLFLGAYALSYFLRVGWIFSTDFPFGPFLATVLTVAPLWIIVLLSLGTFHLTRDQSSWRNGASIAYACIVAIALFTLAYYFRYTAFFSRLLLAIAFLLSAGSAWTAHMLFEHLQRFLLRRDSPVFPTLIVGLSRESKALIRRMNAKRSPFKPVAILDGRGTKETEVDGVPVLGKLNKLEEVLRVRGITHLIQCSDLEQSINLLSACRSHGITYMLLPSVLGIVERDERIETLEGHPVTVVSPPEQWWERFF